MKLKSVQTESVETLLSWAFAQLGTKKPSIDKRAKRKRVVQFVLNLASDKGTPEQKAQAIDAGVRYRCYAELNLFLCQTKLNLSALQVAELTKQVKELAKGRLLKDDLAELVSIALLTKSELFAAALAELVVRQGEFVKLKILTEAVPAIVTKGLVASVVGTISEDRHTSGPGDARIPFLESNLQLVSAPKKPKIVRFLCACGQKFYNHSDQVVLEIQFLYLIKFELQSIFEVAAPKSQELLQRGLDEAAIHFGLTDEVKEFAQTHELKVSPDALKKAIDFQLKRAKCISDVYEATPLLRALLVAAPNEQNRVCMELFKESRWELLGELLIAKLRVESEVRLKTVAELRARKKYNLAAPVMAAEKLPTHRSEYVASITLLPELQAAGGCRMAVTREKIAELFYQDPPEFNLAQDSDALHDWIGAVGWAALRLGSKRDYKHALKLLKPFLKKIYWARIWSVHFAERLKLKRTLSELLTLTITTDECIREVATTRRSLLSILQKEPHGIKVISA